MGKFFEKWNTYQKERFPLIQYIPLVASFSLCAVSYSAKLNNITLSWEAFIVAFITSLSFFMLLRIADEFKDFEEDSKYRAYRPVPRGLIKLKELGVLGGILALIQFSLAYFYYTKLLIILVGIWIYFALMTKEFFVHKWLKAHPITYLWSHMLIMPLIDYYATACQWLPTNSKTHPTLLLIWFLAASFFNGAVIEIGRKIRCSEDEEEGVETYTFLWGNRKAVLSWLFAMSLALTMSILGAIKVNILIPVVAILATVFIICIINGIRFMKEPIKKNAKKFELLSGVWTLSMYLSLGILPLIIK